MSSNKTRNMEEQNQKAFNRLAHRSNIIKKKVSKNHTQNNNKTLLKMNHSQNNTDEVKKNHINREKNDKSEAKNGVKKAGLMEQILHNVEYYPERSRRDMKAKKIKLQPKHDYKVVATTNKRKRRTPHKGENSMHPTLQESPLNPGMKELSLSALVQLAEDQGLDDEDFMEILTCPSPVWWEDSFDEDDIHEVIMKATQEEDKAQDKKTQDNKTQDSKIQDNKTQDNTTQDKKTHEDEKTTTDANANKVPAKNCNPLKNDINFYRKFVTKRAKLEKILGKMKCKKKPKATVKAFNIESDSTKKDNSYTKDNNTKDVNAKELIIPTDTTQKKNNKHRKRTRRNSFLDASFNDEELLNTLESVEIPVKEIKRDGKDNKITNEIVMMEIRNKPVDNNELNLKPIKLNRKRTRTPSGDNEMKLENEIFAVKEDNEVIINDVSLCEEGVYIVPTEFAPLTKYPYKNTPEPYESPKSVESVNSETTSIIELDSISDTNIKFLDEYVDTSGPTEALNVKKLEKGPDGELVTVYQIVSSKTDGEDDIEQQIKVNLVNKSPQTTTDVGSKYNGEINTFFKKRKSVYRCKSKYKKDS